MILGSIFCAIHLLQFSYLCRHKSSNVNMQMTLWLLSLKINQSVPFIFFIVAAVKNQLPIGNLQLQSPITIILMNFFHLFLHYKLKYFLYLDQEDTPRSQAPIPSVTSTGIPSSMPGPSSRSGVPYKPATQAGGRRITVKATGREDLKGAKGGAGQYLCFHCFHGY